MSDIMSDMKQVNAREFQKEFSKVAEALKQGQTIAVTKRGKPLGYFTKAETRTQVPMPNFAANLENVPYSAEEGERIVSQVIDDTVP
jgi:antitoxin (DNA-binding transcriptional repressor) of toxin-antitoxin stability system